MKHAVNVAAVALLLLLGSVVAISADKLEECNAAKEDWLVQFRALETLACFDASLKVNCESHACLSAIGAVHMAAGALATACAAVDGYVALVNETEVINAVNSYANSQCNKCVIAWEAFKRENASWYLAGCEDKLGTADICSGSCASKARDLIDRWTIMLADGLCRQNNPGGCGESGGMTEGEIFDSLSAMFTRMQILTSIPHLCSPTCGSQLHTWYTSWLPLLAPGSSVSGGSCIVIDVAPTSADAIAQTDFSVIIDCKDETCTTAVLALEADYIRLGPTCGAGITGIHKDKLADARHPSICVPPTKWYQSSATYIVAIGVVVLALLVAYVVVGRCCCRKEKNKKGTGCLGCGRPGKVSYMRTSSSDVEENPDYSVADDKL